MGEMRAAMPANDSVYYRDGANHAWALALLKKARLAMFEHFMASMRPTESTRILDIGISDDENEASNFIEKLYPWQHRITGAGLGNGDAVRRAFPQMTFVPITPGSPLPFSDRSFDIACSNAVLEHVGDAAARRAFIEEHLRVADRVFLTIPNRWFPVEHHTRLPFLHYAPRLFRRVIAGTRLDYWSHSRNLDFLDAAQLRAEWPGPVQVLPTGLRLGPFSSNLAAIVG